MKLNRDQFLETGYLIVRNALPANKLEELRTSHEILVERQKCNLGARASAGRSAGRDMGDGSAASIEPSQHSGVNRRAYNKRRGTLAL